QQIRTVVPVYETFAITIRGGDVTRAGLSQSLIDDCVDATGDLRIDKRRELGVLIVCGARDDLRKTFRQCFANVFDMRRGPDCRRIHARASAVVSDRSDHHVEILFPFVDAVFADDDLAVAWLMYFHSWIVLPNISGWCVARQERT